MYRCEISRLRDKRVARLYSKSLLLRILFVVLNGFWISNGDFRIIFLAINKFQIEKNRLTIISPSNIVEIICKLNHLSDKTSMIL